MDKVLGVYAVVLNKRHDEYNIAMVRNAALHTENGAALIVLFIEMCVTCIVLLMIKDTVGILNYGIIRIVSD